jgi:hypothetical protein
MALAALDRQTIDMFKNLPPPAPDILLAFQEMIKRLDTDGKVHEVSNKQTASIGDTAMRQTEQTAAEAKTAAMAAQAHSNLPPRPTSQPA